MPRLTAVLIALLLTVSHVRAQTPTDSTFYAVTYVEALAAARAPATAALRQYRDASRTQDGHVRIDVFEQIDRPGHFVLVETWRDQKAFDARAASQKPLMDALQPLRASGYDQRPYKALTVAPQATTSARGTVSVMSHVDVNQDPKVPVMLRALAEASRKEPGNVRFDVMQHTMRANHFTIVETWRDQKALEAHVAAAHTKQYRDDVQPMTGSPLDERVVRAIE